MELVKWLLSRKRVLRAKTTSRSKLRRTKNYFGFDAFYTLSVAERGFGCEIEAVVHANF